MSTHEKQSANFAKNFSAYNKIVANFLQQCEEEQLDITNVALFLFQTLVGLGISLPFTGVGSQSPKNPDLSLKSVASAQRALTPAEAKEAKRLALAAKAKRLKCSVNDVRLNETEAKEAKRAYREKLSQDGGGTLDTSNNSVVLGQCPPPATPVIAKKTQISSVQSSQHIIGDGAEEISSKAVKTVSDSLKAASEKLVSKSAVKKSVGVAAPATGQRQTALLRVKQARKQCIRTSPAALIEPCNLHLVAYSNHFLGLVSQWKSYCSRFKQSGLEDPLRDLINPLEETQIMKKLAELVQTCGLKEQSSSPGVYILSNDGGSFWDADRPSRLCPEPLKAPLDQEITDLFDQVGS